MYEWLISGIRLCPLTGSMLSGLSPIALRQEATFFLAQVRSREKPVITEKLNDLSIFFRKITGKTVDFISGEVVAGSDNDPVAES